jgi:uncharacterized protein YfdQ (DUF2303 family)
MSNNIPGTLEAKAALCDAIQIGQVMTALAAAVSEPSQIDGYHFATVPAGYTHKDVTDLVEKTQPTPNRKRGTVVVKDMSSLLAYCDAQQVANKAQATGFIYADPDKRSITAVFNDQRDSVAGWRDHRAEFTSEYTPEFKKWLNNDKQQRGQTEFAEFIEDNFADITEPAAQALLDVATTIQAKTDINFSSAKRLQNGQVQLQYTETIDARAGANGALEIPKEFTLGLRIFKNGSGYKIKARLKYRLHGGAIKFWYELDRPERSIEDAFAGYVEQVRETSGYVVLLGMA